jgi:hypothetical protein
MGVTRWPAVPLHGLLVEFPPITTYPGGNRVTPPLIADPIVTASGGRLVCPRCRAGTATLWIMRDGALVCGRCRSAEPVRR